MKLNTVIDNAKSRMTDLPNFMKQFLRNSWVGYFFRRPNPRDAMIYTKFCMMNWAAILYWIGQSMAYPIV